MSIVAAHASRNTTVNLGLTWIGKDGGWRGAVHGHAAATISTLRPARARLLSFCGSVARQARLADFSNSFERSLSVQVSVNGD